MSQLLHFTACESAVPQNLVTTASIEAYTRKRKTFEISSILNRGPPE